MSLNKKELRERIDEIVWLANSREERGITAKQVYERLEDRGVDVSDRTVREGIKSMWEDELLKRVQGESSSRGRPPMYYYHPDYTPEKLSLSSDKDPTNEEKNNKTKNDKFSVPSEKSGIKEEKKKDEEKIDLGNDAKLEGTSDREEYQSKREQEEQSVGEPSDFPLMNEIRQEHLGRSEYADEIRTAAPELADEDPRELLLEMAQWLVDAIKNVGKDVNTLYNSGDLRKFEERKHELQSLVRLADWYFGRVFRVDYHPETDVEILSVPSVDDMYGENVDIDSLEKPKFDKEGAEKRLNQRVTGDSVVGVWNPDNVESAAGADSSIAAVGIPNRNNPMLRQTIIQLFTGAAALEHEERSYTDYDFETESIRHYRRRDAFTNGLMASPSLRGLTQAQLDKAKYAALDLRLYNETMRVVEGNADWRPVGNRDDVGTSLRSPDVVYGDGRVSPLVHQISDYAQTGLYGQLVRNEMNKFARLMTRIHTDPLVNTVFAGVVKQSRLTWLAPLVFYYLSVHRDDNDRFDQIPREIYQPPIDDSVVAHMLYDGLQKYDDSINSDGDQVFVTFRVQRRFYDYSLDRDRDFPIKTPQSEEYIKTEKKSHWEQYFREFIEKREERGYETIGEKEFDPFAYLCANAATVMTYAAPVSLYNGEKNPPLVLPRIEVATEPEDSGREQLETAVKWFADNADFDGAHSAEEYSTVSDAPVLVPSVITRSDDAAKFLRNQVGKYFEKEFRRYVKNAREVENSSE